MQRKKLRKTATVVVGCLLRKKKTFLWSSSSETQGQSVEASEKFGTNGGEGVEGGGGERREKERKKSPWANWLSKLFPASADLYLYKSKQNQAKK